MKIHLLVGHYNEDYEGQLAPNVFLAVDEYTMEENPAYWTEAVAKEKALVEGAVQAWAEVVVEVPMDALLDALHPRRRPIQATVQNPVETEEN